MEILNSIRKEVLNLNYYTAGKVPAKKGVRCIKLSSNENPFGSSPLALKQIKRVLKGKLFRYPDPGINGLRNALVNFWKKRNIVIDPTQLLFGDGSGEILNMLMLAFISQNDAVIIPEKSFILYSLLSIPKGANLVEVQRKNFKIDLDALLKAIKTTKAPKMIILANPDNPTSTMLEKTELISFLREVPPEMAVLIDEAYIHFAGIENSLIGMINEFPNLVISHTYSKAYGLAGLRVGYAVMNPEVEKQVEKVRLPFNLGILQQEGAKAALSDEGFLMKTLKETTRGRIYIEEELGKLDIWYLKSYGNFIFANLGNKSDKIVKYLEENGITIRNLESFGFTSNYVRISIGKMADNIYLIKKLNEAIKLFCGG